MTARRKRPPQVGMIGSAIAAGLKMSISYDAIGWHNNADVELLALRDQLGADYRIADFVARSRLRHGLPGVQRCVRPPATMWGCA